MKNQSIFSKILIILAIIYSFCVENAFSMHNRRRGLGRVAHPIAHAPVLLRVHRLASPAQGGAECGWFAANGAYCMVAGRNMDEVRAHLTRSPRESVNRWKASIAAAGRQKENVDGIDIERFALPDFGPLARQIKVVDYGAPGVGGGARYVFTQIRQNPQRLADLGFDAVLRGIRERIPFAIVYNGGGHWVAYAVRFDDGQVNVYKTDSCSTVAGDENITDPDHVANVLFELATGKKAEELQSVISPGLLEKLDRLNRAIERPDYRWAENIIREIFRSETINPVLYNKNLKTPIEILKGAGLLIGFVDPFDVKEEEDEASDFLSDDQQDEQVALAQISEQERVAKERVEKESLAQIAAEQVKLEQEKEEARKKALAEQEARDALFAAQFAKQQEEERAAQIARDAQIATQLAQQTQVQQTQVQQVQAQEIRRVRVGKFAAAAKARAGMQEYQSAKAREFQATRRGR